MEEYPVPKSSMRHADPGRAQRFEGLQGLGVLAHHLVLGDLQRQVGGRDAVAREAGDDVVGEAGASAARPVRR